MGKGLIIVESPAKVKTIQRFVGRDYAVEATLGHIKDLPEGELGVDLKKDFEPEYVSIPGKAKVLQKLKKAAKAFRDIYLGPDPDREGEAIAWHVAEAVGDGDKNMHRVLFNEITERAVLEALRHPGKLQQTKYEAQQARRILDRLVGYQISPILWDKVRRGLSAGRVQSVAVRIICEREREIQSFVPEEYWSLTATLAGKDATLPFDARLAKWKGKKVKIANEAEALDIKNGLEGVPYRVIQVTEQEKQRHPLAPFITSRLQQEAYRKLSFPAQKTMRIAQRLYEGMELGELGTVGLITYMRTDSPRVASEAIRQVREWIKERFGESYLPLKPNLYKSRKGAQEAHEAIRPTSMDLTPEKVRGYLDDGQWALYRLIWDRFVASQMASAVYHQTSVEIEAGEAVFTAAGTVPVFQGFMALYVEGVDDQDNGNQEKALPALSEGEVLTLLGLLPRQHFTQPPYRFSEATLIKELEEKGIGRPSTYATILSTIRGKDYVKLEKGKFFPTELGFLVNDLLVVNFPDIFDVEFTAQMEENLDKIEEGEKGWVETLKEFYQPFEKDLEMAKVSMREVKKELIPTDIPCERCGSKMVKRWGKRGYFLACSSYPKCRYTREVDVEGSQEKLTDNGIESSGAPCEKCGAPMVVKTGKFGRFLACSNYPTCRSTRPIETGVRCPQEGCGGMIVERRTRKGKVFYGCSNYPACTFALWDKPIPEKCPQCQYPFLVERQGKGAKVIRCTQKDCGYRATEE